MPDGFYPEPDWAAKIRSEAEETYSIAEAAEFVGVSPQTIVKLIKQGRVGFTHRMNGTIRIHPETLNWRLVPSAT